MPKYEGSTFKDAIYVEDKDGVKHEVLTEDNIEVEASSVEVSPIVGMTATNVQAAIAELKAAIDLL